MTAATAVNANFARPVRRFFRTPKGVLLLLFGVILVLAVPGEGAALVLPGLTGAVVAASITDMAIARLARGVWVFPSGAILSGLIVAFILSPQEPVIVPIATAILAVASKQLVRTRLANIFNPAAVALVAAAIFFKAGESWWGALPDLGWWGVPVLLATGIFIADRINKLPMILVFLAVYFALFTVASLVGSGSQVAEVFRTPDLQAVLFFALFMLDDPPTCPVRYGDQVTFGLIVGVSCFALFKEFGWLYYLPAGLLAGNLYEGLRRWRIAARTTTPRRAPASL